MKKTLITLIALLLSSVMMAGSLVKISYTDRAALERLFADTNLTVHYYNDYEVIATAEHFDAQSMTLLYENAFEDCEVYTLLYSPEPVLHKGPAMPYKNDGAVAIFNKEAKLPERNRDFPEVTEVDPRIRAMMDQVDMDSLQATVQYLQDFQSRIWNSTNAFTASDWIKGRMEALGLEVEQQPFYANTWMGSGQAAPNVIGIQRGTLYPDTYVVCGSHFDSFSYEAMYGGGLCPGADDNATGVASVLESARIMTQYEFEYSIVYCAFGCEEMGLYGSEAYASRCQQQGMDIIGYFNNDMNGYLWGDQIHIHCIYPISVAPIGNYYINVGNIYFPDMPVEHKNQKSLDITYVNFGENHPDYASDLVNMSYVYRDKGDYAKSLELCEKALNIRKSLLGETSVYVGEIYVAMGNTYNTMKDYANTLDNYQKAYDIYRVTNGEDYTTTQRLKEWIVILKEKVKDK